MTRDDVADIRQSVFRVIAAALQVPTVQPSSSIHNMLAWDSLSHLQILDALENHFGFTMDLMEIADVECVQDWVDLVGNYTHGSEGDVDE